ncbi:MAG: glutamate--tRNA ligase [Beggiatoa sp. IS2]|nr:MAG: glutamate--tRNA ligase [Beggiatoa sp. IS2]
MNKHPIKTRFAPSPTGLIHLGNARTALFNALYAYHHQGIFLLRIEDTDLERSTADYAQQMMADLQWLGLTWQEGPQIGGTTGPYYQSERNDIYLHYFNQLEQQEQVYPCFCTPQELALSRKLQRTAGQAPRYAGTCAHLSANEKSRKLAQGLQPTLRFRITRKQQIQFTDLVRGQQYFASDDLGDFIIRRADGTPAFFFCNAIDDALMGVTHVFRGEDHLTNTPRQLLILQALGLPMSNYGHISMILGSDGTPLSKRNGSQGIQELKNSGWLAEGVVNYLARLGHTYTYEGYLPFSDLVAQFSIEHLGRAPAHFDERQHHYWQREAITHSTDDSLWTWMGDEVSALVPPAHRAEFITAIKANLVFPQDAFHWATILFRDSITIQAEAQTVITEAGSAFFTQALAALEASQADYKMLITHLKQMSGAKGKALFMPLRAALTGETHGPEMANLLPLIGLQRARERLQACLSR